MSKQRNPGRETKADLKHLVRQLQAEGLPPGTISWELVRRHGHTREVDEVIRETTQGSAPPTASWPSWGDREVGGDPDAGRELLPANPPRRRNPLDAEIRALERASQEGVPGARERLDALRAKLAPPPPDPSELWDLRPRPTFEIVPMRQVCQNYNVWMERAEEEARRAARQAQRLSAALTPERYLRPGRRSGRGRRNPSFDEARRRKEREAKERPPIPSSEVSVLNAWIKEAVEQERLDGLGARGGVYSFPVFFPLDDLFKMYTSHLPLKVIARFLLDVVNAVLPTGVVRPDGATAYLGGKTRSTRRPGPPSFMENLQPVIGAKLDTALDEKTPRVSIITLWRDVFTLCSEEPRVHDAHVPGLALTPFKVYFDRAPDPNEGWGGAQYDVFYVRRWCLLTLSQWTEHEDRGYRTNPQRRNPGGLDEELRRLDREAAAGDLDAEAQAKRLRERMSGPGGPRIAEPLERGAYWLAAADAGEPNGPDLANALWVEVAHSNFRESQLAAARLMVAHRAWEALAWLPWTTVTGPDLQAFRRGDFSRARLESMPRPQSPDGRRPLHDARQIDDSARGLLWRVIGIDGKVPRGALAGIRRGAAARSSWERGLNVHWASPGTPPPILPPGRLWNPRRNPADSDLRSLARAAQETGDPVAVYRYRSALVRLGRGVEAGFKIGDVVKVFERESPWVHGGWTGVLMQAHVPPPVPPGWAPGLPVPEYRVVRTPGEDAPFRPVPFDEFPGGDCYVRPLDYGEGVRVRPDADTVRRGVYLTRQDEVSLVEPWSPGGVLPPGVVLPPRNG